jgi:uncharacterized protein YodC (DUF2158 family)
VSEIKEGDVVALVSDTTGSRMAVGGIKDGKAECLWFVGKELRRAHIPLLALKKMRV